MRKDGRKGSTAMADYLIWGVESTPVNLGKPSGGVGMDDKLLFDQISQQEVVEAQNTYHFLQSH